MKLYIETVGCQMNVLDSELVVASLRKQGYELTRNAARRRHDPVQHLQRPRSTPRTRSTAPWAGSRTPSGSIRDKVIGVLGCMAQKDQELIFERAPYVDLVVGPGQLHQVPELIDEGRRRRGPADGSQPRPQGRQPRRDRAEPRELRPAARSGDAADAVPGVRADHDRLRQVLHVLHRAERPRPGAEPPAGAHPRRGRGNWPTKAARKSRCSARRSTATATARATAPSRLSDLLAALHEIDGIERIKFVTNYPEGHDRRPAGRGARPAEGVASTCTCRCRAARTRCCSG